MPESTITVYDPKEVPFEDNVATISAKIKDYQDAKGIAKDIRECTRIYGLTIDIIGASVSKEIMQEIAEAINNNSSIASLEIARNIPLLNYDKSHMAMWNSTRLGLGGQNQAIINYGERLIIDAFTTNQHKNIISFTGISGNDKGELYKLCRRNEIDVTSLISDIRNNPNNLDARAIQEIKERASSIRYIAEKTFKLSRKDIDNLFSIVENQENNLRISSVKDKIQGMLGLSEANIINKIPDTPRKSGDSFYRFTQGNFSLKDLDNLLEVGASKDKSLISGGVMVWLKEIVNDSLIPHLDYFIIQALKNEDITTVKSANYPNIAKIGKKPFLEAGIIDFTSDSSNTAIATQVDNSTQELDLSFVGDKKAGSIKDRYTQAAQLVDKEITKFEAMFDTTRQAIAGILTQKQDKKTDKQVKEDDLEQARNLNKYLQYQIDSLNFDAGTKQSDLNAKMQKRLDANVLVGLGQVIAGVVFWEPAGLIGGLGIIGDGISNAVRGHSNQTSQEKAISKDVATLNSKSTWLASQQTDEQSIQNSIQAIKNEILQLTQSAEYQQQYGTAQKLDAVKKAYLAKSILDFGKSNHSQLEELCRENKINSLDSFVGEFDSRLENALTNFCFGYADSNDLSVIIAEANSIDEFTTDPKEKVLREIVEEYIKPNIAAHYSHASQVDKIYQANLIGLGTDLYEARQMVCRATDESLTALIGYQQSTQPALIDGKYSARGANDIRRVFEFWLHRHGDRTINDSRINDGETQIKFSPKRISAIPESDQKTFVEIVKQSHTLGQTSMPEISDDFQRLCAYEYFYHQDRNAIANGDKFFTDNPQVLASYPVVNSTVNYFIRSLNMKSLSHFREEVGDRLDNLLAQTTMDFFAELGHQHSSSVKVNQSKSDLLQAKTKPDLFALAFENHIKLLTKEAKNNLPLFLQIYERNLEKMLEVAQVEDRTLLLEQIDVVHELTKGKLKPNVVMPGSKAAIAIARNENHTFENTKWKR